ncbi:MAG TPA: GGDEF domain-containing protein [Candidatus Limnocylindrales bacterium]|nr:GGDEF domain-containing protein [Candidatus Limnocylindrales bacterium]
MSAPPPSPPSRQGATGDPSIRRTWWLLAGAFFLLALTAGIRLVTEKQPVDWLIAGLVVIAAIAAIAHRNAVGGLESRGRGEAESFARIVRSLSRSVSAEAIVAAILDDLVDGTAADHVVFVRRRRDAAALEATLVTRRDGVPTTSTILPLTLLDGSDGEGPKEPVGIPVGRSIEASEPERAALPETRRPAHVPDSVKRADRGAEARAAAGAEAGAEPVALGTLRPIALPTVARRASDPGGGRTLLRRAAAESLALLRDIGLPTPDLLGIRGRAKPSEVLARGDEAVVVERVADRVRATFGLSHTLTAPLRSAEQGVIGAIIVSRRDRDAWPEAARRLVRAAASETAAAFDRAHSFRAAETSASTDPLTGLPNRRYFDEFSSLLSARRRSGDALAVLMIDIDKFKGLNDTYGHPVGDEVLKSVAGAITAAVRDQDVPARIGGEEFAVLLRNPGPAVANEIGERVRQAVRDLDLADMGVPGVSVSVGVANAVGPDEPIHALVDRADRALLRAKRAGRDRVVAG